MLRDMWDLPGSGIEPTSPALAGGLFTMSHQGSTDATTLRAESKEELKSPLMKVKEESEKGGLKPPWSPLDCKEIQPVHSKGDQS